MLRQVRLPLCPSTASPTEEQWLEFGKVLTQALNDISTWADGEMRSLAARIDTVIKTMQNNAKEEERVSKLPTSSFQFYLVKEQQGVTKQVQISDPTPCLYPIHSRAWWYTSRQEFESLLRRHEPEPEAESESSEPESYSCDGEVVGGEVTWIRLPPEDIMQRRRQVYREHLTEGMEVAPPRRPVHPVDHETVEETAVHYDVYLRALALPFGPEGQLNMRLLNYLVSLLNLYYLDHVSIGAKRVQTLFEIGDTKSQMSYQGMVFLCIMHCRVLRQLFCELYDPEGTAPLTSNLSDCGMAYKRLMVGDFPWILANNLGHAKTYKVATYTQSEIDDAFRILLFRTGRLEWNSELHHYVHLLSDRLACFFYQMMPGKVMNLENFRKRQQARFLKIRQRNDKKPPPKEPVYSYNLDFLIRCYWRYFYVMQNVMGLEQLMNKSNEGKGLQVPMFKSQPLEFPKDLGVDAFPYSRDTVRGLATYIHKNIHEIFAKYSQGERNTINEQIRKAAIQAILPQGDMEWAKYKYPLTAANNANGIMETLHAAHYKAVKLELFGAENDKILDIYIKDELGKGERPLRFIHDYFILYLFDKHLARGLASLRFLSQYVIPQRDIHLFAKLLYNSREPFVRQWMGRYYVCFDNHISLVSNDIYEVIAEWVLVAFKFCAELWENIQDYGQQLLPPVFLAYNNCQFLVDVNTDAMDIDEPTAPIIQLEREENEEGPTDSLLIL